MGEAHTFILHFAFYCCVYSAKKERFRAPFSLFFRCLLIPEGFGGFGAAGAVSGFELEFLALDADGGAGRNGMGDEDVGTDNAVPSDDRAAA